MIDKQARLNLLGINKKSFNSLSEIVVPVGKNLKNYYRAAHRIIRRNRPDPVRSGIIDEAYLKVKVPKGEQKQLAQDFASLALGDQRIKGAERLRNILHEEHTRELMRRHPFR